MRYRGYTLIELMVSLSVFTVVITIAAGGYLIMINVNRHAQSVATGINNLSFALDTMTRNIRTGTGYQCDGLSNCESGGARFSFTDQDNNRVTYTLNGTSIQSTEVSSSGDIVTYSLTESAVNISKMTFYVTGVGGTSGSPGDYYQPHVTLVISGTVSVGPGVSQSFTIQTGATMRGTDL